MIPRAQRPVPSIAAVGPLVALLTLGSDLELGAAIGACMRHGASVEG